MIRCISLLNDKFIAKTSMYLYLLMILQCKMCFSCHRAARKWPLVYCIGKACLADDIFLMFTYI